MVNIILEEKPKYLPELLNGSRKTHGSEDSVQTRLNSAALLCAARVCRPRLWRGPVAAPRETRESGSRPRLTLRFLSCIIQSFKKYFKKN